MSSKKFIEVGTVSIHVDHRYYSGIKKAKITSYDRAHMNTDREQEDHLDISSSVEAAYETSAAEFIKSGVSGKISAAYKSITKRRSKEESEVESKKEYEVDLDPEKIQIHRVVTTTFSINGRAGSEKIDEHVKSLAQFTDDEADTFSKKYMKDNYGVEDGKIMTFKILEKKYHYWVALSRGDPIPKNAVKGAVFGLDGRTWVGRYNQIPGKINDRGGTREDPLMRNCWVHGLDGHQTGEVLVTNKDVSWVRFIKGDLAECEHHVHDGMRTSVDGDLVVGKSIEGEPGKLIFQDGKYDHLWCHTSCKNTEGFVLRLV